MSHRHQQQQNNWHDKLHVVVGKESNHTEHCETNELRQSEQMDHSLFDAANERCGGVRILFSENELHALKELIAIE